MIKDMNIIHLLNNILILMNSRNLSFSDVEKEIGISIGYLSKMIKKGEAANPSMSTIWKLANYFDISVERLVDGDVTDPYDNLRLIIATMDFCRMNTISGTMKWKPITIESINEQLHAEESTLPIIGYRKHCVPLKEPYPNRIPSTVSESCYKDKAIISHLAPNVRIYAVGPGYKGLASENNWFHLYKLGGCFQPIQSEEIDGSEPEFTTFYDVWIEDTTTGKPKYSYVCTTRDADLQMRESIEQLYKTIDNAKTDITLDSDVRNILKSIVDSNAKSNPKSEVEYE